MNELLDSLKYRGGLMQWNPAICDAATSQAACWYGSTLLFIKEI